MSHQMHDSDWETDSDNRRPSELEHGDLLPPDCYTVAISGVELISGTPATLENLRVLITHEGLINATHLTLEQALPLFDALGRETDDWIGYRLACLPNAEPGVEVPVARVPAQWCYRVVKRPLKCLPYDPVLDFARSMDEGPTWSESPTCPPDRGLE